MCIRDSPTAGTRTGCGTTQPMPIPCAATTSYGTWTHWTWRSSTKPAPTCSGCTTSSRSASAATRRRRDSYPAARGGRTTPRPHDRGHHPGRRVLPLDGAFAHGRVDRGRRRTQRPRLAAEPPHARETRWRCHGAVSYTHLRAHETVLDLVCR